MRVFSSLGLFVLIFISACERIGIPDPAKDAANREADARATGSACRHAGRAIEDCYTLNQELPRAAVYAGWKEMNDYMRENKIESVKPELPPPEKPKPPEPVVEPSEEDAASESASASASASASKSAKASNH